MLGYLQNSFLALDGVLSAVDLLQHLLLSEREKGVTIADVVSQDAAAIISEPTALETLPEIFSASKIAVVLEDQSPVGVVTKIDLIDYLAGRIA